MRQSLHLENFLFPSWFLLFWAAERRRWGWAALATVSLLMVKQDQAVWLSAWACWALLFRRVPWRAGLAFLAAGIAAYVTFQLIIFSAPRTGIDQEVGWYWLTRYGAEGVRTPTELALWFAQHPGVLAQRLLLNPAWIAVIASGGALCLLGWRPFLLVLPPAFLLFAAQPSEPFHQLLYYYSYPLIAPLFYAAAEGAGWVLQRWPSDRVRLGLAAGVVAVALAQLAFPTRVDGWSAWGPRADAALWQRSRVARELIRQALPPGSPRVACVHYELNAFPPHGRQVLFLREDQLPRADMVILDVTRVSADLGREKYLELLAKLLGPESEWRTVEELDGFMILERKEPRP